jgi:hypothetical protein
MTNPPLERAYASTLTRIFLGLWDMFVEFEFEMKYEDASWFYSILSP